MVLDEDWQLQFALFFSLGVAIQEQLQTWLLLFCHQTKYSLWLLFFFSIFSFHLCFCQLPSGIIFACKLFSYRRKEKNNCYDLSVGSLQHKCHWNPCAECPVQAGPSMAPLVWILWPSLWMPSVVVVFLAWEGPETDSDNLNSAFGLQYLKKRV